MAACSRCQKPKVVVRGLCGACYQHCKKHGLPLPPKVNRSFEEWMALAERTSSGCLLWPGPLTDQGYGYSAVQHGEHRVHRIAFARVYGAIPEHGTIDHVCHNAAASCAGGPSCSHRRCFEPRHLECVSSGENYARSPNVYGKADACPQGHPYSGDNLYRTPLGGYRQCRTCKNAAAKRHSNGAHPDRQPPPQERTHCPQGHPYDTENTSIKLSTGERRCRHCARDQARARYWRRKAEGAT